MGKNKAIVVPVLLCILVLLSCSKNLGVPESPKLSVGLDELETMYKQLVVLSESTTCTNASDWSFTAVGNKPCGGPSGYIAYSTQIDTMDFLAKVDAYTVAHRQYNMDNGIVSNCAVEPPPIGINCKEEKPVLIYDRCQLFPNSGPCEAAISKYYFDQETKTCKEFLWGGCDGVVPFDTVDECSKCSDGG